MDERTLGAIYALIQNVELAVRQAFDVPFSLPTCPECGGFLSVAPDRGGLICTKCGAEYSLALKAEKPAKPAEARGGAPSAQAEPRGPTTREGPEGSITPFILEAPEPLPVDAGPTKWVYGQLDKFGKKHGYEWTAVEEGGELVRLEIRDREGKGKTPSDEEVKTIQRWLEWAAKAVKRPRRG